MIKVKCYDLRTLGLVDEQNPVQGYTRELNKELCIGLFILYTKTPWSMLLYL